MSTQNKERPLELSKVRRWAATMVLSASLLVIMMDLSILNVALPDLAADLKPTANQQLWIIDIYSLILAGLLVPMSALADRWGRRLMLLLGLGVFGGASLLILLAGDSMSVIAVRALLGVGGAMIMPTTLSLIRIIFTDPAERAKALGVWAAVSSLGIAFGPIVGGLLLDHFSWQAAFLINVPLMVLAIIAGLLLLPESRSANPPLWDMPGSVMSVAGMIGLVWGIKRFAKEGWTDPLVWISLIGAAALLAWFVVRCLRRSNPLLDVRLFSRAPFTGGVLAAFLSMFAMAALLLLVAQWLQLVEGHSPLQAGIHLLPLAAGAMIASLLAPALAARIGARATLAGGLFFAGAGFLVMYVFPELTYGAVLVTLMLAGAGAGSLAIASAIIMSGTPPEKAGNAAAIEESAYDLGNVFGIAMLGSIASWIYRDHLKAETLVDQGLPSSLVATVEDSLGGALAIAQELGANDLVEHARSAFTDSLVGTGLVGAIIMMLAATAVFFLIPKGHDITKQEH
ncbi:MFS transporter [Paenibacillus sp. GXUN7292]|uniref:MFS transporter n=1 Tax=Paenibacillus sp. GXUN7292 TaxID=3422499 RepID=UPI003D7CFEFF